MAERKVSVRLSVVDGGKFKAELAELGAAGNQALGAIGIGADKAGKAVQLNAQQMGNLQFQIQDIATSLASGQNPFTVMLQQGSQIVQMFGPGTGVLGALKAVGTGLITFLTNPLNLALLGFSAATAAAGYLFSTISGDGKEANKTLEEQEDLIGRIADKYGQALPQVQRYADEIDRAKRSAELADAQAAAIERAWAEATQGFEAAQNDILEAMSLLQLLGNTQALSQLQSAVGGLEEALKSNTATAEQAQRIHDLLMQLFRDSGIPITETLAIKFGELGRAIASARTEAAAIGQEFSGNVPAAGVLAALDAELEALDKSQEQLRIERELRKANVDAASEEGQAIAAKVREIFAETAARKEALATERQAEAARRSALSRASADFERRQAEAARELAAAERRGKAEADRQHEAVVQLIESLKAEIEIAKTSDPIQKELIRLRSRMAGATAEERAEIEKLIAAKLALANADQKQGGLFGTAIDYLKDFAKKAGTVADLIKETISSAFSSAEEAVAQFVRTGKVNFTSLISSMLADLARLAVRQAVLGPLANLLSSFLSGSGGGIGSLIGGLLGSADGNVFSQGSLVPFAGGGIVNSATLFPMRGGLGLMGEAGPEAIIPLARRRDGKLGVRGGSSHVTINITTPDIESFRRARTQVAADIARAVAFGSRGL